MRRLNFLEQIGKIVQIVHMIEIGEIGKMVEKGEIGKIGPGVKIWHDLLLFRHFHHCMSLLSKKIYLTRNWDLHNFSTKNWGGDLT